MPIYNELFALLVFMGVDLFTGIWKAIKLKNFSSRKLAETIGKVILYYSGIIIAQIADTYFHFPKIGQILIAAIVLVEITSIFENIKAITGSDLFDKALNLVKREKQP